MGRVLALVVLAMLAGGSRAASAAPLAVSIAASASVGAAPLTVTFEAHGDSASYHWDLGNGSTADGPTASATYGAGLWTVNVTATASDGATAQASVAVRSEAITLRATGRSRYGKATTFRGEVVPEVGGESVALYVGGRDVADAFAGPDGTFRLLLTRVRTPGPYEARTAVAASPPVALAVRPVLRVRFAGSRVVTVGRPLSLAARVLPASAGTLSIGVYRDGRLVRSTRAGPAASLKLATSRAAVYSVSVGVEPAQGWVGATGAAVARVCDPVPSSGLVYRSYAGAGYQFQPLLSFTALNRAVSAKRWCNVRGLASALVARAVRSGAAAYWNYDFSFQGGPVPWRSGFAQAVAAQALARAGALLQDSALLHEAAAAFRGIRGRLLMPLAGGEWIREYGFTHQVILNAQLQSIISLDSYAAVADSAPARRLADQLALAARRLLPRFDLGCWARYQLEGGPATLHYQDYQVDLLRQLAATRPEPIWSRMYRRWRQCLPVATA